MPRTSPSDAPSKAANLRAEGRGDPLRVVMGLADRDSVAFSMPGHQDSLYAFSTSGEEVTVSTEIDMHLRADAPMH